jgi:hypothetical protein
LIQAGQFAVAVEQRAQSLLAHTLITQALSRAYQDLFFVIALIYLGLVAIAFFLRVPKSTTDLRPDGHG